MDQTYTNVDINFVSPGTTSQNFSPSLRWRSKHFNRSIWIFSYQFEQCRSTEPDTFAFRRVTWSFLICSARAGLPGICGISHGQGGWLCACPEQLAGSSWKPMGALGNVTELQAGHGFGHSAAADLEEFTNCKSLSASQCQSRPTPS